MLINTTMIQSGASVTIMHGHNAYHGGFRCQWLPDFYWLEAPSKGGIALDSLAVLLNG